MNNPIEDLTAKFLKTCGDAGESEQRVIDRLAKRRHISRNTHQEFEESLTVGQRFADRIAIFGGSWTSLLFSCRCFLSGSCSIRLFCRASANPLIPIPTFFSTSFYPCWRPYKP